LRFFQHILSVNLCQLLLKLLWATMRCFCIWRQMNWRMCIWVTNAQFHSEKSLIFTSHFLEQNTITEKAVFLKFKTIENHLINKIDILYDLMSSIEISLLHWSSTVDEYDVMITDSYESSLEALFDYVSCKFCLKTVLLLTEQLISCLKLLHLKFIIHENLMSIRLTLEDAAWQNQQVFLINFNSAQRCSESEASALHDLETLNHILIYLCSSQCFWTEFHASMQEICKDKLNHLSSVFAIYFEHIAQNIRSDYACLWQMFHNFYKKLSLNNQWNDNFSDLESYLLKKHYLNQHQKLNSEFESDIEVLYDALQKKLIKIETTFDIVIVSQNQI